MLVHTFRGRGAYSALPPTRPAPICRRFTRHGRRSSRSEMHRDEPHAGVDVNTCLDDIDVHGFHLTDAHERITHLVVA